MGKDARCAPRAPQRGLSLVELLVALTMVAATTLVLINYVTIGYRDADNHRDRVFAYSKAQTILAELHALVESSEDAVAKDLDVFDDGNNFNPVLTTATLGGKPIDAAHPLSGNIKLSANIRKPGDSQSQDGWLWSRRIEVRPFAGINNRNVRYVTVQVFRRSPRGQAREVATLSSVINSIGDAFPTTQVFDIFLLAIESIPGWWVYMENIVPSVEAAITDLEIRNPGLSLRTHWITKAGYGRSEVYCPYTNEAADSNQVVDSVYYYPGRMPAGNASNFYYVPAMMRGYVNVDGTRINGYDSNSNPQPYAISDFYNHTMRLPKARARHEARLTAIADRQAAIESARAGGTSEPAELADMSTEPTLQLLLEDMCTNAERYRNALIVNLHGELIPMPALRNYSDPAKDPKRLPGVRVVTHPEQLRTHRDPGGANSEDVQLRVYAYTTDPGYYTGPETLDVMHSIRLKIMDVDLTNGSVNTLQPGVKIKNLRGGVKVNGSAEYSTVGLGDPALPDSKFWGNPTLATGEMNCFVGFVDPGPGQRKFTLIYLINTPVVAPYVEEPATTLGRGLENDTRSRLYGMEYVPSPTRDKTFERDLSATGSGPKNTARWRITIPASILSNRRFVEPTTRLYHNPPGDVMLTVETHIWDPSLPFNTQLLGSGSVFPVPISPGNHSETYTWWASNAEAVPFTERSQFLGDPRHNPYKDLLTGDADFGDGYNWFFDALSDTVAGPTGDYPGISRRFNRWESAMRQDVPRFFELYRTALLRTGAIYTTLTGYSYYYMGHGNEIGYDSVNGYARSIPTHLRPFGSHDKTGHINNITGSRRYVRAAGGGNRFWWGMPWLGELCPDQAWNTFVVSGNLAAGTSTGQFYRQRDSNCHDESKLYVAFDTALDSANQRTSTKGCVSFMNNGSASAHFNHYFYEGTASLYGAGNEMAKNYNFGLPTTVSSNRPFMVGTPDNVPAEFELPPYSTNRTTAVLTQEYYALRPASGSGLVTLTDASKNATSIVVNGLNPTTTLGSTFIAKLSLLAMLQSYFELGKSGTNQRIAQPPRVRIVAPTDVTEINDPKFVDLQWETTWQRWDGRPYTEATKSSFTEAEGDLEYVVMWSSDHGRSWFHIADDSPADPGRRPSKAALILADSRTGDEVVRWSLPADRFPRGVYRVRVDAYRKGQALHYSQHTMRFFIDR